MSPLFLRTSAELRPRCKTALALLRSARRCRAGLLVLLIASCGTEPVSQLDAPTERCYCAVELWGRLSGAVGRSEELTYQADLEYSCAEDHAACSVAGHWVTSDQRGSSFRFLPSTAADHDFGEGDELTISTDGVRCEATSGKFEGLQFWGKADCDAAPMPVELGVRVYRER